MPSWSEAAAPRPISLRSVPFWRLERSPITPDRPRRRARPASSHGIAAIPRHRARSLRSGSVCASLRGDPPVSHRFTLSYIVHGCSAQRAHAVRTVRLPRAQDSMLSSSAVRCFCSVRLGTLNTCGLTRDVRAASLAGDVRRRLIIAPSPGSPRAQRSGRSIACFIVLFLFCLPRNAQY